MPWGTSQFTAPKHGAPAAWHCFLGVVALSQTYHKEVPNQRGSGCHFPHQEVLGWAGNEGRKALLG